MPCWVQEEVAHAPLPLDYGGPGVVNFERGGIGTNPLEITNQGAA